MIAPYFRLVRKDEDGDPVTKRALFDQLQAEGFSVPMIQMYSRPVYPTRPKYSPNTIYWMWYRYNNDPTNYPLPPYTIDEINAQWAAYGGAWQVAMAEEAKRKAEWEQQLNDYAVTLQNQGFFIQISNDKGVTWEWGPLTTLTGKLYTWWDMVYYLTWVAKLWQQAQINQWKWFALRSTGTGTAFLAQQPLSDLDK